MKYGYKSLFVVFISVSSFYSVPAQIAQPNAPSNLSAIAQSRTSIHLTWNDNSDNEDGFEIYRKYSADSLYSFHTLVNSNVTSFTDKDLEYGTEYCYSIRAFNIARYSDYTPLACTVTLPPPLIDVRFPDSVKDGENITVNVFPDTNLQFTIHQIFYRITGKLNYSQLDLIPSGNSFGGNIPASYSTISGIQYYALFSDSIDTLTYPEDNPVDIPASLQVKIDSMSYPHDIIPVTYRMISVPLEISNSKLSSVFEDDYSSYNTSYWRLCIWDPQINEYREYPDINSDLEPGTAFWLITKEGKSFDIENALSVISDSAYTIELKPGYNQIANPFAFPVAWSSVVNTGLVNNPISYNPETNDWDSLNSTILNPWEGYFVYNSSAQNISIKIPPIENPVGSLNKEKFYQKQIKDEFVLQIKANIEFTKIQDYQNYVGMKVNAKVGYDKLDIYEPPPITQDLKLSIIKGDKEYAQNIVPVSSEGAIWDLKITTQSGDQNLILNFDETVQLPEKFEIWLADLEKDKWIRVTNNTASVNLSCKEEHLKIIVGTHEYAENIIENVALVPVQYHLSQNYPNPFNPVTSIKFGIPERTKLQLAVYDILGRKVKSIIDEEVKNPGWYQVSFNASSLASGVYIYVIKSKNYSAAMKMLLIK